MGPPASPGAAAWAASAGQVGTGDGAATALSHGRAKQRGREPWEQPYDGGQDEEPGADQHCEYHLKYMKPLPRRVCGRLEEIYQTTNNNRITTTRTNRFDLTGPETETESHSHQVLSTTARSVVGMTSPLGAASTEENKQIFLGGTEMLHCMGVYDYERVNKRYLIL